MGKTRLKTGERKDIFLYKTRVENLFINEFLPDAPGDCVKVFLFGLMYAQYDQQIDSRTMALTLGITEKDVDNAWKYWESKGLVSLTADGEGGIEEIEFIRQIDLFYGKTLEDAYPVNGKNAGEEASEDAGSEASDDAEPHEQDDSAAAIIDRLINRQLRDMFRKYEMQTGRTLSTHEARKLTDSIKVYNIEPDVLDFAIDYCLGIDKTSIDYICKVALRWTEDGARDVGAVKIMLDKRSKRNDAYRKVFAELGWNRLPNPADREIMDRWFDEMGCTIKEVLDACRAAGGMRDPNLRYVNKVLENRNLEKGGINTWAEQQKKAAAAGQPQIQTGTPETEETARVSRKVLRDYYDYIRSEGEKAHKARLAEVLEKIPEMREIFSAETQINSLMITMKPGPDVRDRRQRLKEKRMELDEKKRALLTGSGYPEDHLERKYRCDICKDTGYTDEGRVCTCAKERAEEAYEWIRRKGNR